MINKSLHMCLINNYEHCRNHLKNACFRLLFEFSTLYIRLCTSMYVDYHQIRLHAPKVIISKYDHICQNPLHMHAAISLLIKGPSIV